MGLSGRGAGYGKALSEEGFTVNTAVAGSLTPPAAAYTAVVSVDADCRFKMIGTATSSSGHYLTAGNQVEVFKDELNTFSIIGAVVSAAVFVTYYGNN